MDTSTLPTYFQGLQNEKKELEYKLDQMRLKRKDMEEKQDNISKDNLILNQKFDSINRTCQVAKRKCTDTQCHIDNIQKQNDSLRNTVEQTKQKISTIEKNKENLIVSYIGKYNSLAENFRNARKYYVDSVLKKEENEQQVTCEERKCIVISSEGVVDKLSQLLDQVDVCKDSSVEEQPAKLEWVQFLESKDLAMSLLTEEKNCAVVKEEELKRSVDELSKTLEDSKSHLLHEESLLLAST